MRDDTMRAERNKPIMITNVLSFQDIIHRQNICYQCHIRSLPNGVRESVCASHTLVVCRRIALDSYALTTREVFLLFRHFFDYLFSSTSFSLVASAPPLFPSKPSFHRLCLSSYFVLSTFPFDTHLQCTHCISLSESFYSLPVPSLGIIYGWRSVVSLVSLYERVSSSLSLPTRQGKLWRSDVLKGEIDDSSSHCLSRWMRFFLPFHEKFAESERESSSSSFCNRTND